MSTIKLEPSYLVGLKTRLVGGVDYKREEIEHREEGEADVLKWETERTITDKEEFAEARRIQNKARSLVKGVCIPTDFGLICPLNEEAALDARIAEATALVDDFNATAVHSKIKFRTIRGAISESKAEAMVSVREEIGGLLEDLERVTKQGNVKEIRDLANRANNMGKLLEQKSSARDALSRAVKQARTIARQVVAEVEKKGEDLAAVLEKQSMAPIATARFLFSDDDVPPPDVAADMEDLPAASNVRFAALAQEGEGGAPAEETEAAPDAPEEEAPASAIPAGRFASLAAGPPPADAPPVPADPAT